MRLIPRKRFWRRVFFVCAGGLFLLVAALGTLRVPAVQTRLVRWAMAGGDGWRFEVARVSLGLAGGEARGLTLRMPGIEASAEPGVAVSVRPERLLLGSRELHVERIDATGIKIVVTPAEMASSSSAPFDGLLAAARSPLPWALAAAKLDADVEVREAGADVARAKLRIEGGGVTPTAAGEFTYELEVASRLLPPGPDAMVRSRGVARVKQGSQNEVAEVELRGDLRLPVYGAVAIPPGEFTLKIAATPGGESYSGEMKWGALAATRFAAEFSREAGRVKGELGGEFDAGVAAWAGLPAAELPSGKLRAASSFAINMADGRLNARMAAGPATSEKEWLVATTTDGKSFELALNELPLAWLAGPLAARGVKLEFSASSLLSGGWRVAPTAAGGVRVETTRKLEIGPVRWDDGASPALPAVRAEVNFSAALVDGRVDFELDELRVIAEGGYWPEAKLAMAGHWNLAAPSGGELTRLRAALEYAATEPADKKSEPTGAALFELGEPLRVGAAGNPIWSANALLARVSLRDFSLAPLTRWAGGWTITGRVHEGRAELRAVDDRGGLALRAEKTWRMEGLGVTDAAGAVLFAGRAAFRPELERDGAGRVSGRVAELAVADDRGRALTGELSGFWNEADSAYGGEVAVRASVPAGEFLPAELGAPEVELRAKAGSLAPNVGQIESLSVTVRGGADELASLRSNGPWLYARRPSGEFLLSATAPWSLKTSALPLAKVRSWLPADLVVAGEVAPTEWLVVSELGKWQVRPLKQLSISGLSVARGGETQVRDAAAAFYPGLDLRILHTFQPTFQFVWSASLHATDGKIDTSAGRALEFEAALGVVGDLENALPKTVDLVARGELAGWRAMLPPLAERLPRAGRMTARVDGDMLGAEPLEAWARIEAVPAAEGGRELAPLEVSAKGKVNGKARTADFAVALKMGDGADAGDLGFGLKLALGDSDGILRFDSALRGRRWDMAESLAWARACDGGAHAAAAVAENSSPVAPTAGVDTRSATPIGSSFWGALRGVFELDIAEVRMAPYRVTNLRGRVELEERSLVVRDLGGEMFAGKLGGEFTLAYEPGAEGGDHALGGELRIQQFETARVVQTVFPNEYGSLDARVNLRAAVRGRGFRLWDLVERAEADFAVDGRGVARLTHPDARTASTLLVMGGVLTLSPELRALGRLLRKFAEMPVDDLRIEGGRSADGTLRLSRVRLDSPQVRLEGAGEVIAAQDVPLPARALALSMGLSAKDETGVILGRMKLLEKPADAEGFRRLVAPVVIKGEAGRPDASSLYDLLARGVTGSRGTWGLIMRKVQREVEKQQALVAKEAAKKS